MQGREISPPKKSYHTLTAKTMQKYSTVFLIVSIILAFGADWDVWACIIVICASVLELIQVTPKIRRYLNESKKD